MQDNELYQNILGLCTPWQVPNAKLDTSPEAIRVQVDHSRGTKFRCPDCCQKFPCYDHGEERQWRQLDSCQFKTTLLARVPGGQCPAHEAKSVAIRWAERMKMFAWTLKTRIATGSTSSWHRFPLRWAGPLPTVIQDGP